MSTLTHRDERSRAARIAVRTSPVKKELIERAADLRAQTVTDFMVEAAAREAQLVILEEARIRLPQGTWDAFARALDYPPRPSRRLRRLMRTPTVLERGH